MKPRRDDTITDDELFVLLMPRVRCWEKDSYTTALDNPATADAVVPVGNDFDEYAKKVNETLVAAGIRSNAYISDDNMKSKIKMITKEHKTPYILIVGQKEMEEGTVSVRFRQSSGLEQKTFKLEDFVAYVQDKVNTHFVGI